MDLSTMKVKLDRSKYASLDKFHEDACLLARNQLLFHLHSADAPQFRAAQRLHYGWSLSLRNLRRALRPNGVEAEAVLSAEHIETVSVARVVPAAQNAQVMPPSAAKPTAELKAAEAASVSIASAASTLTSSAAAAASSSVPLPFPPSAVNAEGATELVATVLADSSLQFSLLMLSDARMHRLFVQHLASSLLRLFSKQQQLSREGILLPYELPEARFLLQLCQLAYHSDLHLTVLGQDVVLRCHLPYLLAHYCDAQEGVKGLVQSCLEMYPVSDVRVRVGSLLNFLELFATQIVDH
jgi:hypothetical protein